MAPKQTWFIFDPPGKLHIFTKMVLSLLHLLILKDKSVTTTQVGCDFDKGLCDGWHQSTSDAFDWTRHNGSTESPIGPAYDHTSGSGHYMYIEASSPRVTGDNAKLELFVPGNGEQSCLEFYYHMNGEAMGTLTVFSGNVVVFNASKNFRDRWIEAERTISSNTTVTFEGIVGSSYTAELAIDDVTISTGSCLGCDFDSGLCHGWRQSNSDVFDWTRHRASTASSNTGPNFDHTTWRGYYMYIEASFPQVAGDNAKLELFVPGDGELSCLRFYYHMYGYTMGNLIVFSGNVAVFNESGNYGIYWIEAERTISSNTSVTFEGIVGSGFMGDLAIDDVSTRNGSCPVAISCDFDRALCDGWRQSFSSVVFLWSRRWGPTPSANTGPHGDHTSGSGFYMYIETSSPRVAGDNAKLELSVSGNGEVSCLEFYYHMYGDTMGTLTVYSGSKVVFNTSGNRGEYWIKEEITIHLNSTVTFEGITGSSFRGDLAIDDVSIRNGRCQRQTTHPTFSTVTTFPASFSSVSVTLNPFTDTSSTVNSSSANPSLSSELSTLSSYSANPSFSLHPTSVNFSTAMPSLSLASQTLSTSTVKQLLSSYPSTFSSYIRNLFMSSEASTSTPLSNNPSLSLEPSMLTFTPSSAKTSLSSQLSTLIPSSTVMPSTSSESFTFSQSTAKLSMSSEPSTFNPSAANPAKLSTSSESSTFTSSTAKPSISSASSTFTLSTAKPPLSSASRTLTAPTVKSSTSTESSAFTRSTTKPSMSTESSTISPSTAKLSMSSEPSTFNPSAAKPLQSLDSSTPTLFTANRSLSLKSSTFTWATVTPSLSSEYSIFNSVTVKPTMLSCPSTYYPSAVHLSSSSESSRFNASLAITSSFPRPSLSFYGLSDTSKSTPAQQNSLAKERQESVILEVKGLDIKKWNGQLKKDFKEEVASVATYYCAVYQTRCQSTSTSSRRKRSSNNLVFTSDMVHIIPGYPKASPDDPLITLLAFYLKFTNGVVGKDVLQDIVKINLPSIERSTGGTILSVQPLFITADAVEESDKESQPGSAIIIGASVGGVLLFIIIIGAVVLCCKRNDRFNNQWVKAGDNSYNNDAYYVDPGEQTIEMKSTIRTYSLSIAPDTKPEEHFYMANDACQQAEYGP